MSSEAPTDALRLVPVEPTPKMLKAAFAAMNATPSGEWKRMKAESKTPRELFDAKMRPRWVAMLAAAPASPLPGGGPLSKNLGQLKSGQCSGIAGELSGWQDISTFTESGQGNPVIVAVPTREGGWIVGGAWKSVMEADDPYRGNDGWWWAGTSPGDAYNDPIRFMNHGDAEWWMPLPAAPTGEAK